VHLDNVMIPGSPGATRMRSADALLIEQIRGGSAEAGRRFVDTFYLGVYRYLLYLTGDPETAEDLTQETFVQAWRGLGALDDPVLLRPWLHRIAHREFLQALRAERPQTSLDEITEVSEPHSAEFTEAVELRQVLRKLPIEEREVVVLHYLEGYRSEEIAQITGMPLGRVRHRLVEARARLRQELSDEEPGTGERGQR
jgi:RNA polymerase sigma-70 factor (ECF subfamily)